MLIDDMFVERLMKISEEQNKQIEAMISIQSKLVDKVLELQTLVIGLRRLIQEKEQ